MKKIIAIIFGVVCIIVSLPHEEELDLLIATGTIDVETNWVGIMIGIAVIIYTLIKSIKN